MQEDNLDFDIDLEIEPLGLREFGVIGIASHIWDVHFSNIKAPLIDAKNRGKIKFPTWSQQEKGEPDKFLYKMKVEIIKVIPLWSNLKCCPKTTATAIQTKVLELCDQLYDWIMYMVEDLKFDSEYVDKIYFTSKGEIDTSQIFSHWISIPSYEPAGWFFQKFKPLHLLACLFDLEYLSNFQTNIIDEIVSTFPGITIDLNPIFRIISIMIYCYKTFLDGKDLVAIHVNQLNETNLTAIAMLQICQNYNFYKPFVYFYNHLDAIQELNFLDKISNTKSSFASYKLKYGKESSFQITVFLLKKMNNFQKFHFIFNNFQFIFSHFLGKESYQKFCIPLLDKFFLQCCQNIYGPESMLKQGFQALSLSLKLGIDYRFHVQVFQSLVKNSPKNYKEQIFSRQKYNLIDDMYHEFCTPALRTVINDPDLQNLKAQLLKKGETKFKSLIEQKNYKALDKFMVEVLSSKALHDEFNKTMTNSLEVWITNCHFHFLDNYLTWKYAERAREFKSQLYPLWCSLVPKIYDNIQKLLMWFFDKKEIPTIKNCYYDHEIVLLKKFCQELIYNIWFRSKNVIRNWSNPTCTDLSINLSTRILTSVFISSEEITKFKKTELIKDESFVRCFCENALKNNNAEKNIEYRFVALDEFVEFCALPKDKTDEIKELVAHDIKDWIVKYGVKVNRFDVVVPLLDWVYGEKAENREMLANYFQDRDKLNFYYEIRKSN